MLEDIGQLLPWNIKAQGGVEHLHYKTIQKEAENFYYFTINAATTEDIHFMSEAEITQYKILTAIDK